jgi:predicted class III extradiol MEMO1 family dioxygenase
VKLSRSTPRSISSKFASFPIYKSIEALDKEGMDILTISEGGEVVKKAIEVHSSFAEYLSRTRNTICGRHPIGVLLGALSTAEKDIESGGIDRKSSICWVKYDQSSSCETMEDSSVSYASAVVVF